jgi:hypothetical protein
VDAAGATACDPIQASRADAGSRSFAIVDTIAEAAMTPAGKDEVVSGIAKWAGR